MRARTDRLGEAHIRGQRLDTAMDLAIAGGLVVLILVGFAASYRTLRDLAATAGGYPSWLAPAIPLSFDLGIVVLSLKVARAAREGRTAPVLRLLVAALSTATLAANAAAATTGAARLLHAVPPAMFVICFESVVITARRAALERQGLLPQPLPRLRLARWMLAPRSSWSAWRASVLLDPSAAWHTAAAVDSSPVALDHAEALGQGADPSPRRGTDGTRPPIRERHVILQEILQQDPTINAPQLTARLRDLGHVVSVRTAQRLRGQALHQLSPPDA
jgi:Protein of unknown function (DUF2637)